MAEQPKDVQRRALDVRKGVSRRIALQGLQLLDITREATDLENLTPFDIEAVTHLRNATQMLQNACLAYDQLFKDGLGDS